MKNIFLIIALLITGINLSFSQTNKNVGAGYFGHTGTHPGVVLEYEIEKMYSKKASLPIRADIGVYSHPRNHVGLFVDLNVGFRRYFKSGIFLEESIGIGALGTFLNSDGVFKVDDIGNVSDGSRFIAVDLMPSLTLGIGFDLTKNRDRKTLIWLRPKIFWQYPHKTTSTFHPAIQLGLTYKLSGAE